MVTNHSAADYWACGKRWRWTAVRERNPAFDSEVTHHMCAQEELRLVSASPSQPLCYDPPGSGTQIAWAVRHAVTHITHAC